jgi:hypothetical protein
MSFGLMKNKWLILNSPLKVNFKKIGSLMIAIARLHNFCINEQTSVSLQQAEEYIGGYFPRVPLTNDGTPLESTDELNQLFSSNNNKSMSETREAMVERIAKMGLKRPEASRNRLKLCRINNVDDDNNDNNNK